MYRLLLLLLLMFNAAQAEQKLPDDIQYMLFDMYGQVRTKWPVIRYSTDLNVDGLADWVVQKKSCKGQDCKAEIFLCVDNKQGGCSEYCYMEVDSLRNISKTIKTHKCESTC